MSTHLEMLFPRQTARTTVQLLPHEHEEVARFFRWRGGGSGSRCLDAALDRELNEHLEGKRWIFLAVEGEQWIGTVSLALFHDDPELADGGSRVYLQALWVDEKWRRRGVATQLSEHVIREAQERGFREITLAVEPNEEGAKSLYRKLGFEKFKTSHFAWEGELLPVDCLRLNCALG